ncbi:MAG: class I SAM-dependent methyltransferase [Candidatus Lambdaproteobacteria bacterium]|nr:class I SAM-dependent methyltransferase [Candidatus Lambdaproteobacteria bacterium]
MEKKVPPVDVDVLMARVKEKAARRRQALEESQQGRTALGFPGTGSDDAVAAAGQAALADPLTAWRQRSSYRLREFTVRHDRDFVAHAFRGLLKREPDPTAVNRYCARLRSGDITKTWLVGRLRFSKEGRRHAVRVRGLLIPLAFHVLFRVPVLGALVEWPLAFIRLGRSWREARSAEQYNRGEFTRLGDRMALVAAMRDETERALRDTERAFRAFEQTAQADFARLKRDLALQDRRIGVLLEEARRLLPESGADAFPQVVREEADHRLDALYASFEDVFRGTREVIKGRLAVYVPYIRDAGGGTRAAPLLDIGCGRGEWLELLREERLEGRGVDTNRVFLEQCRKDGLDVTEADALSYLRGLPECSLGGVTAFHLIEHLPFNVLIDLFDEAARVLRPGGVLVCETPNPDNLLVGSRNFYLDPTHRKPLPPDLVAFLAKYRGFARVRVLPLHPRLEYDPADAERDDPMAPIRMALYGPQDYAVIAYRG